MNRFLEKYVIYFRNNIQADLNQVSFSNVHSAKNKIIVKGKNNSLTIVGDGHMRESSCNIEGVNNRVLIGNESKLTGNCSIRINGDNNSIELCDGCTLVNCSIYITGNNNIIKIEKNVSSVIASFHIENDNNSVMIGEGTSIHGRENGIVEFVLEESTSIIIGEDCMISNNVCLRSSDSHSILNNKGERINPAEDITINNHVWIGMRVLILKGTEVKTGCIVGANSVCNRNYEKNNCLIAGNPARIVKENIDWSRDRL